MFEQTHWIDFKKTNAESTMMSFNIYRDLQFKRFYKSIPYCYD